MFPDTPGKRPEPVFEKKKAKPLPVSKEGVTYEEGDDTEEAADKEDGGAAGNADRPGKTVKRRHLDKEKHEGSGKRAPLQVEGTKAQKPPVHEGTLQDAVAEAEKPEDKDTGLADAGREPSPEPVEEEAVDELKTEVPVKKPQASTDRNKAKTAQEPDLATAEREAAEDTEKAEADKSVGGIRIVGSTHISDEFYNEAAGDLEGYLDRNRNEENPKAEAAGKEAGDCGVDLTGAGAEPADKYTPGPCLRTRSKRPLYPGKAALLEDEVSDYAEESDETAWTEDRRRNRVLRYNKRSQLEPVSPPLHELAGNRELMADFQVWCDEHYTAQSTARTMVSSIFRRGDGKSLLEFTVQDKSGFKAEQFSDFTSRSNFVLPPDPSAWVYGVFRRYHDADAALQ